MVPPTKAQIRFQCRRGMLELDYLFERFVENKFDQLSDEDKCLFSRFLKLEDPVLYQWLLAAQEPEDSGYKRIIEMMK